MIMECNVELSLSDENGFNEVHVRIHVPVEKGFPQQHTLYNILYKWS